MVKTMTEYTKLGLRCGLEIHQQLEGRKLFAPTPCALRDDAPHGTVTRTLRAVAGETGEVDVAAAAEMRKQRTFIYEYYRDTTSLVELDEAPPIAMSAEALRTTLQFAKMVDAKPADHIQVMRKTVIDGSNTSGFQRTSLVARNGLLKTPHGDIRIPSICIEEDAARIIKQDGSSVTYRLDRLGIPLIEITTGPDLKDPDQVTDVAERIGMLLRSTGNVKRGLGTIRQDLNVSIKGGERIEIKGAQDLKMLSTLVANEVQRQQGLLALAQELMGMKPLAPHICNVTAIVKDVQSPIIQRVLKNNGVVLGVKIPHATGILGLELQPGKRYGSELADYARVFAGVAGIIHSDEDLSKYGLKEKTVDLLNELKCGEKDAFVLVAAPQAQAHKALEAVVERHNLAPKGVLKEVRKANDDGTTSFLRPIPGAARMYPETDVSPIPVTKELWNGITLPERIDERAERYVRLGLGKDLADFAARSEAYATFDAFVKRFDALKPAYIAEVFFTSARSIKRQFNIEIAPTVDDFGALFEALQTGRITKELIIDILKERKPVADVLAGHIMLSDDELASAIDEVIKINAGKPFNVVMGAAMAKLRGKASGQKISELLKKKMQSKA